MVKPRESSSFLAMVIVLQRRREKGNDNLAQHSKQCMSNRHTHIHTHKHTKRRHKCLDEDVQPSALFVFFFQDNMCSMSLAHVKTHSLNTMACCALKNLSGPSCWKMSSGLQVSRSLQLACAQCAVNGRTSSSEAAEAVQERRERERERERTCVCVFVCLYVCACVRACEHDGRNSSWFDPTHTNRLHNTYLKTETSRLCCWLSLLPPLQCLQSHGHATRR